MSNARKPVDPVHFFDARGNHVSRLDRLEQENARLRARNERLVAMLRALKRKAALAGDQAPDVTTLH
ncbi:hypothetical protein [Methylobacterium sp. AMS5]|uniref:hypothetical protein n=1 Tax=Methylobacterium sp. AMS5 TaxID=925818 RepID=UPI00074FA4AA|nr:hypothetical protein [Methylobacterium sp. AMS5]AMB48288.1 hypothetical protein Y590_25305 [Methylobacterium sp. AMS5]